MDRVEAAAAAPALALLALWAAVAWEVVEVGAVNAIRAARDPALVRALGFSIWQAAASGILAVAAAVPLAYVDATYDYPLRDAVRLVTSLPFTMPPVSVGLAFLLLSRSGVIPGGPIAIILAHAYYNFGLSAQMISNSMRVVPREMEEAASTLGAPPARAALRVLLPLSMRGIASAFFLTFTLSMTSFAVPLMLGGGRYRTVEVEIYTLAKVLLDRDSAYGAAAIQLAVTLAAAAALLRAGIGRSSGLRERRSPSGGGLLGVLYSYLAAAAALFPVAYLFYRASVDPMTGEMRPSVFLDVLSTKYDPVLGTSPLVPTLNSLYFAVLTSTIVLAASSMAAVAPSEVRRPLAAAVTGTLGTSSITVAIGAYSLCLRADLPGWVGIAISHVLIAAPFALQAVESGLGGLSRELLEAAETLGASRADAVFRVLLPAAAPAILSAAVYSFNISLAETTASTFLATPETQTLPVAALRLSGGRRFQEAAAASAVLVGMTALGFWIQGILEGRMRWSRSR